ncbi:MAG: NifB/NifX family molybdenum-iron cluster-binding protein [Nitrospirota bacterium]
MKICFPVAEAAGTESKVYGHFGSAPAFVVVETDTNSVTVLENCDKQHSHGACSPLKALNNQKIDAVVVGGIGMGALNKLNLLGIKVFRAQALTVEENIALLKNKALPLCVVEQCCPGHGHGSGCGDRENL